MTIASGNPFFDFQKALNNLPGSQSLSFKHLWEQMNIAYLVGSRMVLPTELDKINSALVNATILERTSLLLVLPDSDPSHLSFILAPAILQTAHFTLKNQVINKHILCFSSNIQLRKDLLNVRVKRLEDSNIVQQVILGERARIQFRDPKELPTFIFTSLSPEKMVRSPENLQPLWTFIDCDRVERNICSSNIIKILEEKKIPVIAVTSNPFSPIIDTFRSNNMNVFQWPSSGIRNLRTPKTTENLLTMCIEGLENPEKTLVHSLAVVKENSSISTLFRNVYRKLMRAKENAKGGLQSKAIALSFRYFNALKTLTVPINLFDCECKNFWGVQTLETRKGSLQYVLRYLEKTDSALIDTLSDVYGDLAKIHTIFENQLPPRGLSIIKALERIQGNEKCVFCFNTMANKIIFSYYLLAKHNITMSKLATKNIFLLSVKEFAAFFNAQKRRSQCSFLKLPEDILNSLNRDFSVERTEVVFMSLPNSYLLKYLCVFACFKDLHFLIYPYEYHSLMILLKYAQKNMILDINDNFTSLSNLSKIPICSVNVKRSKIFELVNFTEELACDFKTSIPVLDTNQTTTDEFSLQKELAFLLSDEEDTEITTSSLHRISDSVSLELEDDQVRNDFVQKAVELQFEESYIGRFSEDTLLYVIKSFRGKLKLQKAFVKSLRKGERIVFLPQQKRQNLYDLLIEKLHNQGPIQIHLSFISHWQTELLEAYMVWKHNGGNLKDLLSKMQGSGSKIQSLQAIRSWINGYILHPRDPNDLLRLSQILNMSFTQQNYKRIHKAATRLANLHRMISHRLSKSIETGMDKNSGDLIDNETGLTNQDLMESVLVLTLQSMRVVSGIYFESDLGIFEKG